MAGREGRCLEKSLKALLGVSVPDLGGLPDLAEQWARDEGFDLRRWQSPDPHPTWRQLRHNTVPPELEGRWIALLLEPTADVAHAVVARGWDFSFDSKFPRHDFDTWTAQEQNLVHCLYDECLCFGGYYQPRAA